MMDVHDLGKNTLDCPNRLTESTETQLDDTNQSQLMSAEGSANGFPTDAEEGQDANERFTFFWKTDSPFSQWHPCLFVIDGQQYNSAEQYMMHQKAVTFGDLSTANRILKSDSPIAQKRCGRKVANFNEDEWNSISRNIVKQGNLAKFSQNDNLKRSLLETAGTTLVEASPTDRIWGIGLAEANPMAQNRKQWLGENSLGQILTEIREEFVYSDKI